MEKKERNIIWNKKQQVATNDSSLDCYKGRRNNRYLGSHFMLAWLAFPEIFPAEKAPSRSTEHYHQLRINDHYSSNFETKRWLKRTIKNFVNWINNGSLKNSGNTYFLMILSKLILKKSQANSRPAVWPDTPEMADVMSWVRILDSSMEYSRSLGRDVGLYVCLFKCFLKLLWCAWKMQTRPGRKWSLQSLFDLPSRRSNVFNFGVLLPPP